VLVHVAVEQRRWRGCGGSCKCGNRRWRRFRWKFGGSERPIPSRVSGNSRLPR